MTTPRRPSNDRNARHLAVIGHPVGMTVEQCRAARTLICISDEKFVVHYTSDRRHRPDPLLLTHIRSEGPGSMFGTSHHDTITSAVAAADTAIAFPRGDRHTDSSDVWEATDTAFTAGLRVVIVLPGGRIVTAPARVEELAHG